MKKILVCEDEEAIRDFVVINLQRSGYTTVDVGSGEEALRVFEEQRDFDVAVLDIIMLTAKTQEMDKVRGLMLGADDYVTKPFSPSELVARVDAVYRRVSMSSSAREDNRPILSGCFVLSPKSRTLTKNGEPVDLTQVEYQIMEYFIKNKNVALERSRILEHIWGDSYNGDVKIVDVNIRRLRMKIEDEPSKPVYIQTIWGYGYKWQEPV